MEAAIGSFVHLDRFNKANSVQGKLQIDGLLCCPTSVLGVQGFEIRLTVNWPFATLLPSSVGSDPQI